MWLDEYETAHLMKMKFLIFALLLASTAAVECQTNSNWPSFHGSDRLNKSQETGLLESWPAGGPALVWKATGIGEGYSSVSIVDGLLYTSGKSENQTFVFAFDLNGTLVWKKPNGPAWDVEVSWASSYNGSRSTPTYDNGIIYHLSEAGRLSAYQAKTGDAVWSRDLTKDFEATIPMYGYSESVLIDGNNLFVRPGGQKGFQVCLNKLTGETIWANKEVTGTCGYNSSVMMDLGGFHQVIGASSNCFYGIDSKSGNLLWKVDFENQYGVNCTDAVIRNEYVYMTTSQGKGSMLIKLIPSATSITAEKVWQTALLDNYHGGVLLHNGLVFGSASTSRSWYCIDFMTGEQKWKSPGTGSLTFAEGMLYLLDEKGTVKLVKASDTLEKTGEFKLPAGGAGPTWAHPVVCGGRLYLRHAGAVFAYDITKK